MSDWIEDEDFASSRSRYSLDSIAHLDGVPWHEAPVPRRWHRCRAQTLAWVNSERVARCACGAIQIGAPTYWDGRNRR